MLDSGGVNSPCPWLIGVDCASADALKCANCKFLLEDNAFDKGAEAKAGVVPVFPLC
jgi:hypothetical protein